MDFVVPAAIPFALAAAFFPPALAVMVWLLATPPGLRRALIYLSGAATATTGSGALILILLRGIEIDPGRRAAIEGSVQLVVGAACLLVAIALLIRRPRPELRAAPGRTGGQAGIFLLGVAMWTPSFAYLAAIDLIVDSGLGLPAQLLNLLFVDVIVLISIEVPVVAYRLAPRASLGIVTRVDELVRRHGWQLGRFAAGTGGIYLCVRGWLQLGS